jgi:hypothetical protein
MVVAVITISEPDFLSYESAFTDAAAEGDEKGQLATAVCRMWTPSRGQGGQLEKGKGVPYRYPLKIFLQLSDQLSFSHASLFTENPLIFLNGAGIFISI